MKHSLPHIGVLASGPLNRITDVKGVSVGHKTIADGKLQTGVTVIRPHQDEVFTNRVPAAVSVFNGFGKSMGLMQVEELGVIETSIALTNTFGVPAVAEAQIRQAIAFNPEIGRSLSTVNPLVLECNDGYLNDIQALAVRGADYLEAWGSACAQFDQGSVGAGRGMSCFQLKGGIGSASRIARIRGGRDGAAQYTLGVLVLANFGKLRRLTVAGDPLGQRLQSQLPQIDGYEKGSIIMVIATDAPLDARQLRRLSGRAVVGLARTGSVIEHGSGDIALAFSTAYTLACDGADQAMPGLAFLKDASLDPLFEACADASEQAILNALWSATSVTGRDGHVRKAITSFAKL